jgi:nicotinamide-nucleotide amidase
MPTDAARRLHTLLTRSGLTIAAAESLTTGLVQTRLGSCSGSSSYYKGGITAYSIHQKVEHLGVDGKHAAAVNCVSERVARQMARGVCKMFDSDIGIATTGYAEPDPTRDIEIPFAYVGFAYKKRHFEFKVVCDDDREGVQEDVAQQAMERLTVWIRGVIGD